MPSVAEALSQALAAARAGDRAGAQRIYQEIQQQTPGEPNSLRGLGVLACEAGDLTTAEDYLLRAIAASPDDLAVHNNLSLVYRRQGRPNEAAECCRKALALEPDSAELHNNLGVALKQGQDFQAAADSFRRSVELRPTYVARYNLANTLVELHELALAEQEFRRALQIESTSSEIHNNLGRILQIQGRLPEAIKCFDSAVRCNPRDPAPHRNRALLKLLMGDYDEGWREYEWRWRMSRHRLPNIAQPMWQGQELPRGTILLLHEQGLGDLMQFIRYALPVRDRSKARVLLHCPRRWHALLQTAPGIDRLVAEDARAEPIDCYAPMMSLPRILGTTLATIPGGVPYLSADPGGVERWRRELDAFDRFKVGIAWQGNANFEGDFYRSIPLAQFAPLAECDRVKLFSLQKNLGREQIGEWGERLGIVDLGSAIDEGTGAFVDTAAVMMNLDLVITSDTSIAHLAGAMGVPVWVVLPYAPDWRWLLDRESSPWYPSMRLFRQPRFDDWASAFLEIASQLKHLSESNETRYQQG